MNSLRWLLIFSFFALVATRLTAAEPGAKPAKPSREKLTEKMKEFDTDGDGKLSADERAAAKKAFEDRKAGVAGLGKGGAGKEAVKNKVFAQFDTNGNGKLDPDEQAAARAAAKERRSRKDNPDGAGNANGGIPPGPGNGGPNGFGPPGGAGPPGDGYQKLLKRFDLNRDGILEPAERERAKQMMEQMRQNGDGNFNFPPQLPPGGLPPGVGQPNVPPQKPFRQ